MKVYGFAMSPFVQRVLLTCRTKGIDYELVQPEGGLTTPEFLALSPNSRIPVIEEDDGWTMVESMAIVEYLDATRPGPSLLPASARDAARARAIVALADSEIGPGVRQYTRQPLLRRYDRPDLLAYTSEMMDFGLDAIERIGVTGGRWALGDRISIADIALMPLMALGVMVAEFSDTGDIISGRPGIDAWWARAQADPLGAQMLDELRAGFEHMMRVGYATLAGHA
jgi:glutathione S-transferase